MPARKTTSRAAATAALTIKNEPNPVLGADGKNHLAYETTIVNQAPSPVTLNGIRPRAAGKSFGPALDAPALSKFSGEGHVSKESTLQSGEVVPIDTQVLAGPYKKAMPMGLQVVDFGE